jgi:hypothetical protein
MGSTATAIRGADQTVSLLGRTRGCASGPEGIRTPDLLNAIQTRSQLRHGPTALDAS